MKPPREPIRRLRDYDPAGDSGDRGTPHITRDEMISWLNDMSKNARDRAMARAISQFIDEHGRGAHG